MAANSTDCSSAVAEQEMLDIDAEFAAFQVTSLISFICRQFGLKDQQWLCG